MTLAWFEDILSKHRRSGVFVDTNLMVVLVLGSYDPNCLERHKRTRFVYEPAHFRLLLSLLSRFERKLTTPNILTEVDNLVRQISEAEQAAIALHFQRLVKEMFEIYQESSAHLGGEFHKKVGLTDAILIELAKNHLIVTADFRLANRIEAMGRNVINFNHIRGYAE